MTCNFQPPIIPSDEENGVTVVVVGGICDEEAQRRFDAAQGTLHIPEVILKNEFPLSFW